MSIFNWISIIATAFAAFAAGIAAITSVVIIFVYQKQVKIGQNQVKVSQDQVDASLKQLQVSQDELKANIEQVHISQNQLKLSQEQIYHQYRPILVLSTDENDLTLENAGSGVALNIRGIMFKFKSGETLVGDMLYSLRNPLPAGQRSAIEVKEKYRSHPFITVSCRSEIGEQSKYTLLSNEEGIYRLTMTYHDIFGQKHASIFDGNKCIAVLFDIRKDIEDFEHELNLEENIIAFVQQKTKLASSEGLEWDDIEKKVFKEIIRYGQEQGVLGDLPGWQEEDFINNLVRQQLQGVMEDPYCRAVHRETKWGQSCYGQCGLRKDEHDARKHRCTECYEDF